jgi:signal transduction histidine kinase
LALSEIHYFKEYQKAVDERYKLLLEKERLESAFQIAEAYRHELGNVINIISLALANLIHDEYYQPSREDMDQAVDSIRKSVKRAQTIFNSISRYNEKAKSEFSMENLSLLVEEQLLLQEELIALKNIKLHKEICPDIRILANENFFDAVRYLIEGAVRAVDYYSPQERLIVVKLSRNGSGAKLEIIDTGNDATGNLLYAGVGVERGKDGGLIYFIARRIIFDHKGAFQMVSYAGGKGTAFVVELPVI